MHSDAAASRPDAPILLLTKLHPPVVPAQIVARERLFARLREGRGRRLSLVACPAGFGKSTLLAAWREADSGDRPVAWLSLDEGDNDVVVLWSHVLEALGQACPGLSAAELQAMVPVAPLVEVVLPRLVNELVAQGEAVLILDDFHRLASGPARESLEWFVDHLPASFQLVLATRRTRRCRSARCGRMGNCWSCVRTSCGSPRRGGRVPQRTARPGARSRGCRAAGRAYRGLAGRALSGGALARGQAGQARARARVRRHECARRRLPGRRCAQRLRAGAASVHAAHRGARAPVPRALRRGARPRRRRAALESLARSNLFLIPLDGQRQWFRFHHLFAQILRVELERREPELLPELHRRAYAWHRAYGTTDEAIHHALAARAFDEAGDLIAGRGSTTPTPGGPPRCSTG